MKNQYSARARRWVWLVAAYVLASCAAPSGPTPDPRLTGPRDGDLQRILASPRPPLVVATPSQPAQLSPRSMARLTPEALSEQRGTRLVQIAAVPLLRSTQEGAAFLSAQGHRALAQGEPTASCPALSVAPPGAPTAFAATQASLTLCLDVLARRGAPATCGCRLIALDNALMAPLGRFSFAPAVSALMIKGRKATRLIAEAEVQGDVAITRLRDAAGEIGVLSAASASDEVAAIIDGVVYIGTRAPFGFRRGRLAERITLTGEDGERLSLLVGVERRDATPK